VNPATKLKLETIFNYPLFQSVGKPLPSSVTKINHWAGAAKMSGSHKWSTCQLMANNALCTRVYEQAWSRGQEWNPLAAELNAQIGAFLQILLAKIPVSEKLLPKMENALAWDFMGTCLEYAYKDLVEPFFYIPLVEPWYAAGHFPCGWDGDEFPEGWDGGDRFGQLMVF
jgi:hypothetical protein